MASEAELLDDIRRVAEDLGRAPTSTEYDDLGNWSASTIFHRFDSWSEAVEEAGLEPTQRVGRKRQVSDEDLLEDLQRVARELGSAPTQKEYTEHGDYSVSLAKKRFGNWNTAIREAGLKPTDVKNIPDATLLEDLKRVAEDAGHTPTADEYDRLGEFANDTLVQRFGSWNEALEAAGLEVVQRKGIADEELLADIQRVANRTGNRPPKLTDYDELGEVSAQTIIERFGSWNAALEAAGFSTRHPIPDNKIIEDIQRVRSFLQKAPTMEDYRKHGAFSPEAATARYGGWPEALREANIEPPREIEKQVTNVRIIRDLQRVARELGHIPTQIEYREHGNHSIGTVTGRFGGWENALQEAGIGEESETGSRNPLSRSANMPPMSSRGGRFVDRANDIISEARRADDCDVLNGLFNRAVDLYRSFVDAAERGEVDTPRGQAGTAMAEVGNAWVITRRELVNNGCISDDQESALLLLNVRDAVDERSYDQARQMLSEGERIVAGELSGVENQRCARATAAAMETILNECTDRDGRMEEVEDVFVFVPEGEERGRAIVDRLQRAQRRVEEEEGVDRTR